MITTTKKLKIDYTPLDIFLNVKLMTPTSGLIQTYNVANDEFEPDRELGMMWTVLQPIVHVSTADGSWKHPVANSMLTNVTWLVNGADVSTSSILYSMVNDNTDNNGQLTIKSNVDPGFTFSLQFKATLLDSRKNVTIPIESDVMYMTCSTKAEDVLSISATRQHFSYDVLHDKLANYDYLVSRHLTQPSIVKRKKNLDGNEYLVKFPYIIKYGDNDFTNPFKEIFLSKYDEENKSWRDCSTESYFTPEISEFEKSERGYVVIDCRLIERLSRYRIKVVMSIDGKTYSDYDEFTVRPCPSRYEIEIRNDSGLNVKRRTRYEDVIVTCDNIVIDNPAAHLNIEWTTDKFEKTQSCGALGIIDTWRNGNAFVPITSESESLDVCVSHEPKGAYSLLTNGKGGRGNAQYYLDWDNSFFIITVR